MLPQLAAKLSNCVRLDHSVAIIVPSTYNVNHHEDIDAVVSKAKLEVKQNLSQWFGGVTAYSNCEGGWMSSEHGYVGENVYIIQSYCCEADLVERFDRVLELARWIKALMVQEAVSVICDNELILV